MKKIIILSIIGLFTMMAIAQSQPYEHLAFKGVPIDGTLNEYVSKMQQSGFTLMGTNDGAAMLQGDFAAYRGCTVVVATLKQKDLVSAITVIFPACNTWASLSSNYFSLKEMLTEKYGEPSESVENFQPNEPEGDVFKITYVKLDDCKYHTTYETGKGRIGLTISHEGAVSCYVTLTYFDRINGEIIKAKAMDDL